jgi:hypothetical protein
MSDSSSPVRSADGAGQASVGMSTQVTTAFGKYNKDKVSVSVWMTIPVDPTPEAVATAQDEVAALVLEECDRRMDEAVRRFFPHIVDPEGGAK